MKPPYVILDVKDGLLDNIIVGPLTEEEALRVPSDRLVWPKDGEKISEALNGIFETPPGFTRVVELREAEVNQEHRSIRAFVLAKDQFGIDLPAWTWSGHSRVRNERLLKFFGQLKHWMIEDTDPELLHDAAKRIKILFNKPMWAEARIGRRKGFIVDEVDAGWHSNLAILRYNLAEWERRRKKRKQENAARENELVRKELLTCQEAADLYWGMANSLRNRIQGKDGQYWQWEGPGRSKRERVHSVMQIYNMALRLFGRTFANKLAKEADSYVRDYVKYVKQRGTDNWARKPTVELVRARHRKLKLQRPPAKAKYARFIWDLIHPSSGRSRRRADSARTSSA